jgi:Zn-dependent M28 family amino/carboxypeptidase/Tol biopolymer transport system component
MPYHLVMSRRTLALMAAVLVVGLAPAGLTQSGGQTALSPDARWRRALDAWDAGVYPAALEDLRVIMRSPQAQAYLERVALLTGELHISTEISADGTNPRISSDGRHVSYQTGAAGAVRTRIVRVGTPVETVAELPTSVTSFDLEGRRVAWLRGGTAADTRAAEIVVRDLPNGADRVWLGPGLHKAALSWTRDGRVIFLGADDAEAGRNDVYAAREGTAPVRLTDEPGFKTGPLIDPAGTALIYTSAAASPFAGRTGGAGPGGARGGGAGGGRGGAPVMPAVGIVNLATRTTRVVNGAGLTMSADGSTIAWIVRAPDGTVTLNTSPTLIDKVTQIRTGREPINAPALSPDGKLVAYEYRQFTDWEIYVSDGTTHKRITRDIQHDILPRFLSSTQLVGMIGEPRHRRSQIYDVASGQRTRLFHNNTIRTVVPEYSWQPSDDGQRVLIVADRDGDTVSTERGIYVVDLTRKVTAADVSARIDRQLAAETDLRTRMTAAFKPVADVARKVTGAASVTRVWEHAKALYDFDSKHITQPGNALAIEYLTQAYASFGYKPEQQWFQQANARGGRTANVLATLRGTINPELVYVVSSHFDSVAGGPGADDDTSGTTALLEAARVLAGTPLPATVVFASFTGEEAGLLGSREFVRRAAEAKWNVVGALNNDMIGWDGESGRMDNTIRYSNPGIRDIQHGAAFLFTNLILYDTKYYRGTDAAAFYEAWGDIVGGIGSYPILGNPNYHQATDYLDTINQRQVTETAKVTAATLVYLASSPSRIKDLKAARAASGVAVTWTAGPETGIKHYIVAYGPASDPLRTRLTVVTPTAALPALPAGTHIAVKAVNGRGLEGWDWARVVLQ